jgi:hypothetical protein
MADTEKEMRAETNDYASWVAEQSKAAPPVTANAADLLLDEDETDGDEDDDVEDEDPQEDE